MGDSERNVPGGRWDDSEKTRLPHLFPQNKSQTPVICWRLAVKLALALLPFSKPTVMHRALPRLLLALHACKKKGNAPQRITNAVANDGRFTILNNAA